MLLSSLLSMTSKFVDCENNIYHEAGIDFENNTYYDIDIDYGNDIDYDNGLN